MVLEHGPIEAQFAIGGYDSLKNMALRRVELRQRKNTHRPCIMTLTFSQSLYLRPLIGPLQVWISSLLHYGLRLLQIELFLTLTLTCSLATLAYQFKRYKIPRGFSKGQSNQPLWIKERDVHGFTWRFYEEKLKFFKYSSPFMIPRSEQKINSFSVPQDDEFLRNPCNSSLDPLCAWSFL
ncbi:hypothetical protein VNO77_34310 [Canavalia gladiata]|uniref:Uncharacterized protein n=1 Tax=Canavalia gladiata TaxID=3824 RepID=A0AAN9PZP2_CANGL